MSTTNKFMAILAFASFTVTILLVSLDVLG